MKISALVVFAFMAVSLAGLGVASGAEKAEVKTHHEMLTPDQPAKPDYYQGGADLSRALGAHHW